MKAIRIALAALALTAMPLFAAETWTVDRVHSEVSFTVRHLVTNVRGKFDDFSGTINTDAQNVGLSNVELTIKAASIDTANENRDKHLRSADFFDVEKFPTIEFKSTSIKATANKSVYNVTGNLTMHGVTKTLTIPVTYLGQVKDPGGNTTTGFELTITLNRKDYGISWNKALDSGGTLLGDDVAVNVSIEARHPKQ